MYMSCGVQLDKSLTPPGSDGRKMCKLEECKWKKHALCFAGTTLRFDGDHAAVTTPVLRQELKYTKKFYITKDVDITIQTLRNTTGVSRATNEKVGTHPVHNSYPQQTSLHQ